MLTRSAGHGAGTCAGITGEAASRVTSSLSSTICAFGAVFPTRNGTSIDFSIILRPFVGALREARSMDFPAGVGKMGAPNHKLGVMERYRFCALSGESDGCRTLSAPRAILSTLQVKYSAKPAPPKCSSFQVWRVRLFFTPAVHSPSPGLLLYPPWKVHGCRARAVASV